MAMRPHHASCAATLRLVLLVTACWSVRQGGRLPHRPLANFGGASGPLRSKIGGGASDPEAKLLRGLLLSLVHLVFDLLLETTHLLSQSRQARQTGQLTSLLVALLPSCIVYVPCRKKAQKWFWRGTPALLYFQVLLKTTHLLS